MVGNLSGEGLGDATRGLGGYDVLDDTRAESDADRANTWLDYAESKIRGSREERPAQVDLDFLAVLQRSVNTDPDFLARVAALEEGRRAALEAGGDIGHVQFYALKTFRDRLGLSD